MIEYPPRQKKEEIFQNPEADNDDEITFTQSPDKIEAVNDNEAMYSGTSNSTEAVNDNQVEQQVTDEEKIKVVMEHLKMAATEELSLPEGEVETVTQSVESAKGGGKAAPKLELVKAAAGGAVKKEGGDISGPGAGKETKKKRNGLLWKIFKGTMQWIGIFAGALLTLYLSAINKGIDEGMKQAGGKGGGGATKKPAAGGHGGGGHGH